MELLQLKYFQTVARLEHMTKAAEELHIAQPALSKTIARLEQDIGVPLFDRHKQKIRLNSYGKLFLQQVEPALTMLEEGRRQVADQAGLEQGRIVLATTNHKCDAEFISSFLSAYPKVNLRLTQTTSHDEKIELLLDGELDFCITSLPIEHEEIESIEFLREEIFLVVPSGHPLSNRTSICLSELAGEPFIGLDRKHSYRVLTDQLCKSAGFEPTISCEVDDTTVMSAFVKAGMGVALLTEPAKLKEPSLVLLPIEQPVCQRAFLLAWSRHHYLSKAAHTFRDFLIRYYADFTTELAQ
ncbi:LysR family transcriptional regulator [Paenibacillus favisporus]|uniref:LysR family transcriptional regulator n=1 Tax=Paenibacillus favisporus TaxID=221028 RepID=UPI002DB712DC|nr:LysR family transcriptional regulator [Paenibacillus favisporus]MEC0177591.1 LysR family transcriptional regulator [Paenibacillus favisporus]